MPGTTTAPYYIEESVSQYVEPQEEREGERLDRVTPGVGSRR